MPRTFLATLQFEGTNFAGWQRQRAGRTVQQELESVLARLAGQPVRVHAAGRTDAGVHAFGMATSFVVPDRWTPDALQKAMNALLPNDCCVSDVREARAGFHARKCALERRYEYRIGTDQSARSPFRRRYEWALGLPLELGRLQAAARPLLGQHSFGAFAVKSHLRPHTRCEVRRASWSARTDAAGVRFEVAADRFLHHMVRILTATMVDVALERRPAEDLTRLLAGDPAVRASAPAPPEGLYFVQATYPETWFDLSEAA
ncbi:MAG: tRNA pseudouridine(38-40) synthase TruA [Gemmatimonadales bacterium]